MAGSWVVLGPQQRSCYRLAKLPHLWLYAEVSRGTIELTPKPSLENYFREEAIGLGFRAERSRDEKAYEFNIRAAHQSVSSSDILTGIVGVLRQMRNRYANGNTELLFYPPTIVPLGVV
jgi:hypothetical protein